MPQVGIERGPTVAEEGLLDLRTVDREGPVFGAVGGQSAAVLVHILVARGLVVVPDPPVAGVFDVH